MSVERIFELRDGTSVAVRVKGSDVSVTVLVPYHIEMCVLSATRCKSYGVAVDPQDDGRVYFGNAYMAASPDQVNAIAEFVREAARPA